MRTPLQRVSKRIRKRSRMGQPVVPTKKKKTKAVPGADTVAETIALVVKGKFARKSTVLAKKANVGCKDLKLIAIKKGPGGKKSEKLPAKDVKKTGRKIVTVKMVKKAALELARKAKKEKMELAKKLAASKKESAKKPKKTPAEDGKAMESEPNVIPLSSNVKQEDLKELPNHTNNKVNDKAKNKVVKEPKEPKNCAKKVKSENADATKQIKITAPAPAPAKQNKSSQPKTIETPEPPPPTEQPKEPAEKTEKQKKIALAKEKKLENKIKKAEAIKAKKAMTKLVKENSKSLVNETKRKNNMLKLKDPEAQLVKQPKPESNSNNHKLKKDVKSNLNSKQKPPVDTKSETASPAAAGAATTSATKVTVKTESDVPQSGSASKEGSPAKLKKRTERRVKTEESNLSTDDTSSTSDEMTLDLLRQNRCGSEPDQLPKTLKAPKKPKVKVEHSSDTEKKAGVAETATRGKALAKAGPITKKKAAVKVKPKMVLIKKRILTPAKDKGKGLEEQRMRRMKLFGFWTGPKRHRVASLNAIAKVHCLYENETRGAMLDSLMEATAKLEAQHEAQQKEEKEAKAAKVPKVEKEPKIVVDKVEEVIPKRNLRSAPGIRAIGKHWDMHDTSSTESSSEDNNSNDSTYQCPNRLLVPPPSYKQKMEKQEAAAKKPAPEVPAATKSTVTKRRRNRTEIIMDLKDMVVRKRMASLNASAILAASYSMEKRASRSPKTEDTDETTEGAEDSSDISSTYKRSAKDLGSLGISTESATGDSATPTKKKKCYEADVVKSEDETTGAGGVTGINKVCVAPNKKVAVILNQDTDVTITGVYVNSTTRSTTHEGYCTVAGMQYRISATSHTQTAATAVATETLLHHTTGSNSTEHTNVEQPCKSYTPLGALSSMQPPGAPGAVQHGAPLSPMARRAGHSCPSAFSAPPGGPYGPAHHHPPPPNQAPDQPPPGFIHGYYQPAGPLITAPHNHAPPPPITKSAPQPETSPSPTPPPHHQAPASSAGESSDNDVIITSVTSGTEQPAVPPPQPPPTYRYTQYPAAPPPGYPYPYPPAQYYPALPPPPHPAPTYPHHELCYPPGPYLHHKTYPSPYRRYLAPPPPQNAPQYYPSNPAELYSSPPASNQQNSQVVTASSAVAGSGYQPPSNGPPPPLVDNYPPGPPPLVDPYPPPHYYAGYPTCYTHSPPTRNLAFLDPTYQICPCPTSTCSKNVHAGPLTGDGKRSHISSIAKESLPLPPVALALPLEPASATGPPSPARGSAGMPPPPSPAGATYQQPPQAQGPQWDTKQETTDCKTTEKRRKARVGKTMARNNIVANFPDQRNTMLLMCHAPSDVSKVKREVESPEEVKVSQKTEEVIKDDVKNIQPTVVASLPNVEVESKCEQTVEETVTAPCEQTPQTDIICMKTEKETLTNRSKKKDPDPPVVKEIEEDLDNLPIQTTVAETVKFTSGERQNIIKRKLSITRESEKPSDGTEAVPEKKPKLEKAKTSPTGSYKDLIKKSNAVVKINNGKRKLIGVPSTRSPQSKKLINFKTPKIALKKKTLKRKLSQQSKEETSTKRMKSSKPLIASNLHNSKQNAKNGKLKSLPLPSTELSENTEPANKAPKKTPVINNNNNNNNKSASKKSAPAILDSLFAKNNVDRIIESVVNATSVLIRTSSSNIKATTASADKLCENKSTNNKLALNKTGSKETCVVKATAASKRKTKSKSVEVEPMPVPKIPRKSLQLPRWSNGWSWEGEPYQGKVFLNSDEALVTRNCYPAMRHIEGDIITPRDCVLLKAGARKIDLPFVAKVATLWENPEDGEMMMSLLWYYRPEHTDQGRLPADHQDEVFASRHKDTNSVACIEDKCYVLTFNEYCRYRKALRRLDAYSSEDSCEQVVPLAETYPRSHRQPPSALTSSELVLFCRRVYDFRQKRIVKNPS